MYKIGSDTIKKFKNSIEKTTRMMEAAHKGAMLHPNEVKELIAANKKLVKLIEDNYYV